MAASEATLNLSYLVGVGLAGRIGAALGVRAGFALSGAIFLLGAAASLALVATRRPRHAAPRRAPRMA